MINKIVKIVFIFSMLSSNGQTLDIVFPEKEIGVDNWNIVNDGVMGGISTSSLSINSNSILIFKGYLSLENNGGFASTRMGIKKNSLDNVKSFKIKFDSSLDRPEFVELINNKLDEFPYDSWLSFAHERNTSSANYYFSVKNEKYKSELSYIALTFITEVSLKLN